MDLCFGLSQQRFNGFGLLNIIAPSSGQNPYKLFERSATAVLFI